MNFYVALAICMVMVLVIKFLSSKLGILLDLIFYGGHAKMTDTVQWFCTTYAILTDANKENYSRFPSVVTTPDNESNQIENLNRFWGIKCRSDLDKAITNTFNNGHNTLFIKIMQLLDSADFSSLSYDEKIRLLKLNQNALSIEESEFHAYIKGYDNYKTYGSNAFNAWDYCRAMNLIMWGHTAGYYKKKEALDKSLELAKQIQPLFTSWDDMMQSYLRGYDLWSGGKSHERELVYNDLKTRKNNPFAVDYNTNLTKTW